MMFPLALDLHFLTLGRVDASSKTLRAALQPWHFFEICAEGATVKDECAEAGMLLNDGAFREHLETYYRGVTSAPAFIGQDSAIDEWLSIPSFKEQSPPLLRLLRAVVCRRADEHHSTLILDNKGTLLECDGRTAALSDPVGTLPRLSGQDATGCMYIYERPDAGRELFVHTRYSSSAPGDDYILLDGFWVGIHGTVAGLVARVLEQLGERMPQEVQTVRLYRC